MSMAYCCPVPWFVFTPVAHGVKNRAASGVKGLGHVVETIIGDLWSSGETFIVTVVVFCYTR